MKRVLFVSILGIINLIGCSSIQSQGSFKYITPSSIEVDSIEAIVRQEIANGQEVMLYFSAYYCPPCKKIEKALEDESRFTAVGNVSVIDIDENMTKGQGTIHPLWKKLNVRAVPTIHLVDGNLDSSNRCMSRKWKTPSKKLNNFIEAFWPDKTKEEKEYQELRSLGAQTENKLKNELSQDELISEVSRKSWRQDYLNDIIRENSRGKEIVNSAAELDSLVKIGRHLNITAMRLHAKRGEENVDSKLLYKALSKFEQLIYLELVTFNFFPEEVYQLTNLKSLKTSAGNINHELSPKFAQLKELQTIEFSFSNIKFPSNVNLLENLEHVVYYNNKLKQPRSFYQLPKLKTLSYYVKDKEELEGIYKLRNLEFLSINYFHEDLAKLDNLKALKLGMLGAYEIPAKDFKGFPKLKLLYIPFGNQSVAPEFISNISTLRGLIFSNCASLREVPASYTNLKNLKYLQFGFYNEIPEYSIPKQLTVAPIIYSRRLTS